LKSLLFKQVEQDNARIKPTASFFMALKNVALPQPVAWCCYLFVIIIIFMAFTENMFAGIVTHEKNTRKNLH
jgi:hypothetical protein